MINFPHSRVHRLKSFDTPCCQCYVKRDDELIYGSKTRKYHSLLPYLIREEFKEIVLVGGANSNHILAMTQLLLVHQRTPTLFLRQGYQLKNQGNSYLLSVLIPPSSIYWIARQEWSEAEKIVLQYTQQKENTILIPEGGSIQEAFPGALSIATDIIRNEQEHNTYFDHIFIDAGTGFTAIAALLGMLEEENNRHFHILLLADDQKTFLSKLNFWHQKMFREKPLPCHFTLHVPTNARSFGSINRQLKDEIKRVQETENVLLEPIYSGKLFFEARRILTEKMLVGKVLIVHSGLGVRMKQELKEVNSVF